MDINKNSYDVKKFGNLEDYSGQKMHVINGFVGNRRQICEHFGFNNSSVCKRMKRNNETFEEAIDYYIKNGVKGYQKKNEIVEFNGMKGTKKELCKHFNLNYDAINKYSKKHNITFSESIELHLNKNNIGAKLYMSNIRSKNKVNGIIHTINGFTGTQNKICEHFGFKKVTIYRHMNKFNKSFEDTIYYYLENGVEERSKSTFNINGIVGCKKELCRYFNVSESSIHSRMKRCNETFEEALINFIKDNSIHNRRKNRIINICNDSGTINELCNKYNLKYNTVSRYANRHNITFEKSLEIHILNKINSKES